MVHPFLINIEVWSQKILVRNSYS